MWYKDSYKVGFTGADIDLNIYLEMKVPTMAKTTQK